MKLTEIKRKDIIEAAIEEFREHGFRGAKTSRIAGRANVSSRTLYKHFESKDALFDTISELIVRQRSTRPTGQFDPARELETQLAEALERYLKVVTEPEFIALTRMVMAEMLINRERSRAYSVLIESFQLSVSQIISGAMDAGVIRKAEPVYAARQLISLVRDFFYTPELMLDKEQENNAGVMSDCIKMFLSHYKIETE